MLKKYSQMDIYLQEIYSTIYKNAVLFLKRGIKEIIQNDKEIFDLEIAIISCLYIQTSIELSLKAYLIKEVGINAILKSNTTFSTDILLVKFKQNHLKTKTYEELKNILKDNSDFIFFTNLHFDHLTKFQLYRNKLIHLNLFLSEDEIINLKKELIFAVTHLLMPLLTDISFEFESPSEFYQEHLDGKDFNKLISFQPYVDEMHRMAVEYSGLAYECINCCKKTFSPNNEICYCCNLNLLYSAGYIDCEACEAKRAIVYDTLNIHEEGNEHSINGVCMNCGDKMNVYECPDCEIRFTFYGQPDFVEKICKC
ncbi:hypothetical protein CMU41_12425 [Elizabethkingia anophelis]|jgi:hypothetical protein|uniref:Uncharacterized protein n=2 Tax=Flavobacteriales TaxID=200644 RepID=A0A7Z7PY50_9FLAO|nr:hypothetical protein [Elizabethkingia anophelis]ODM53845.1 hypothetical protein BES09_06475 [Elizabethkingia meningoseptica]MDV3712620.1 hypothetical protein [Elizabethkingia anophelis]MDV3767337.1 hypothetical protein [Elizabethkingia anophelis]OHT29073.1 hypothetical protein BFF93_06485 [Elizabethkingia meningoseptica]